MKRLMFFVMMNCIGQELSQRDSDVHASLSQRRAATSVSSYKSSVNVCAILSIIFCVGGFIAVVCALSVAISLSIAGGLFCGGIAFLMMACVGNKETTRYTSTSISDTYTASNNGSTAWFVKSPLHQSENLISFCPQDSSIIYDDDMKEISVIVPLDESDLFNDYPLRASSEIVD